MTQAEVEEISEKAKVIADLNVMEFLKMIEEKAKAWKGLINGS